MTPRYRAWVKTEKRMIETDDLLDIDYENEVITTQQVYFENGLPDDRDLDNFVFEEIKLMQSTEFTDKNGQKIFEGDVLGTKDGLLNGVVEYRSDLGMWTNSLISYNNFERLCNVAGNREIIGNIYENPELLEDKE